MASSPQKNLQFISPPKEAGDFLQNQVKEGTVTKTTISGNTVETGQATYEDGKYHGDRTMTRYEMAEIIYNALSKGAKAEKKLVEEFKPELQAMAAQKKA